MKRKSLIFGLVCLFILSLMGCSAAEKSAQPGSSSSDSGAESLSCGVQFDSLEAVLGNRDYDPDGVTIAVGTLGDVIRQNKLSDVYAFEIQQLVRGEAEEIHLFQMKDGNRLHTGKTYLLLFFKRPVDDPNEYEVAGAGNQCAFWIENGRVQGYDAAMVQQLREAEPEIDTIEKLAAYFE